ncbi:hypothetical protein [Streptomyces sp. NPDC052496]|uniref:tetratricopeptide repeat protein n=1 Tax=Streptomyces sp. NPDC052496 TaxID=3154951 RepID=UPI00342D61D7
MLSDAWADAEAARRADATDPLAIFLLANLLQEHGQFEEALGLLSTALERAPFETELRIARADVLNEMDRKSEALQDLSIVVSRWPHHAVGLISQALVHITSGSEEDLRFASCRTACPGQPCNARDAGGHRTERRTAPARTCPYARAEPLPSVRRRSDMPQRSRVPHASGRPRPCAHSVERGLVCVPPQSGNACDTFLAAPAHGSGRARAAGRRDGAPSETDEFFSLVVRGTVQLGRERWAAAADDAATALRQQPEHLPCLWVHGAASLQLGDRARAQSDWAKMQTRNAAHPLTGLLAQLLAASSRQATDWGSLVHEALQWVGTIRTVLGL